MKPARSTFGTEADLCRAFTTAVVEESVRDPWKIYAETAGFDILLIRDRDGTQIGIEAKLSLNTKVLMQALPEYIVRSYAETGPDYRACLVPDCAAGIDPLCAALGVTVIRQRSEGALPRFWPPLPGAYPGSWHEWAPIRRCEVPEYVPDVVAGASAPVALTEWKIAAIKMSILLEERIVTRADFKALKLSPARWTDPYTRWLEPRDGGYVRGPKLPDFKEQHPRNYEEIRADKAKWMPSASVLRLRSATPDLPGLAEASQP